MIKKLNLMSIVVVFIFLLCSNVCAAKITEDDKAVGVLNDENNSNNVTISTVEKHIAADNLKVTLKYPLITGLADKTVQKKLNTLFKKEAINAKNQGLKCAVVLSQSEYGGTKLCETYLDYKIAYNQNGLLSVVFSEYQYAGGAHGSTTQSSYTFDLQTGEELKLNDLLNADKKYTSYINAIIKKEIDKKVASGDLFELEKFKSIGKNPAFYLSDEGIVFYFQQYEYFPYAAGIQEFVIPFPLLKDKIMKGYEFLYKEAVILNPDQNNDLLVGDIARVILEGNPTTGYSWYYTITTNDIVSLITQNYRSNSNAIGAGGVYNWYFKALKAGKTTITFRYYRQWEGESSAKAEYTKVYTITVK